MMVGNVYTKFYIVLILTVAGATLNVYKMKRWLAMCTPCSIVSTLTVAVATLSVNKMKMMFGNVYTKFYSVGSNDWS